MFHQVWEMGTQTWIGVRSQFSIHRCDTWQVYISQKFNLPMCSAVKKLMLAGYSQVFWYLCFDVLSKSPYLMAWFRSVANDCFAHWKKCKIKHYKLTLSLLLLNQKSHEKMWLMLGSIIQIVSWVSLSWVLD